MHQPDRNDEPVCLWCSRKTDERASLRFLLEGSEGFCADCCAVLEKNLQRKKRGRRDILFRFDDALTPLWMRVFVHHDMETVRALLDWILSKRKIRKKLFKKRIWLADERLRRQPDLWLDLLKGRGMDVSFSRPEKKAYTAVLLFENPEKETELFRHSLCKKTAVLQKNPDYAAKDKADFRSLFRLNMILAKIFRKNKMPQK